MYTRLDPDVLDAALARIERSARRPPRTRGEGDRLLPVSTLRVAADHFRHDSVRRSGARAIRLLQSYAPDCVVLALALRLPGFEALPTNPARVDTLLGRLESGEEGLQPAALLAHEVYRRVARQLSVQPVQDLRIDFHEGSDLRSDEEEDQTASSAATEVALAMREGLLGPRIGIRIAPLSGGTAARAFRTLDLFVSTLCERAGAIPEPFVVSIPGLTHEDQVSAIVQVAGTLETRLGLPRGCLRLELGLSDAESAFDETGSFRLPVLVAAASGRCAALRIDASAVARSLGTRDPASATALRDLARLALAGQSVPISWGASPDLPRNPPQPAQSGDRRAPPRDAPERYALVHAAWRTHAEQVTRAIRDGYPWGWDHDAGLLPARLAAVTAHYLQLLPTLRSEVDVPSDRIGVRLRDELRVGLDCGAISADDFVGTVLHAEP